MKLPVPVCLLFIAFFSLSVCPKATAQGGNVFNLNIDNGLPDNWVYGLTVDHNGYMWLATEKGVVKYNGYDCKTFNITDGLPTEPTWQVFEDKKGRIWLGNLSDQIGYIYKDTYNKPYFNTQNHLIYPVDIRATNSGIIFYTSHVNSDSGGTFCVERNDTIRKYKIPDNVSKLALNTHYEATVPFCMISIGPDGVPIIIYGTSIFKAIIGNGVDSCIKIAELKDPLSKSLATYGFKSISGHYLILENPVKDNKYYTIDLYTGKLSEVNIKQWCGGNEDICYVYHKNFNAPDKFYYIVTNHFILKFGNENGADFVSKTPIKEICNADVDGTNVNAYFIDSFWGNWLSTSTNGLYVNYDTAIYFKKANDEPLRNFKFVGGNPDNVMMWWNRSSHSLAVLIDNKPIRYFSFDDVKNIKSINIRKIIHYDNDSFFVMTQTGNSTFWLNSSTGKMERVQHLDYKITETIFQDKNYFFFVDIDNFEQAFLGRTGNVVEEIDRERYGGLTYDNLRKTYWAYNSYKIATYKNSGKKTVYNKESFGKFGVNSVEKIVIDSLYGNVFLKGNDIVSVYNPTNNKYTQLFNDLYLKESEIFLYHNTFIVVGRFGVLFSKILGPDSLSDPVIYFNRKNTLYKRISDVQISWNKILLKTDKGFYRVDIPSEEKMNHAEKIRSRYKLLVLYKNEIVSAGQHDTIKINQRNLQLHFDVINPFGNGKVKYYFKTGKTDTIWHELFSNELILSPQLVPGEYHHITVLAHDDVWKSEEKIICIYIQPYWWQRIYYSRFFWATTVVFVLALIALIVYITRRIVMQKNIKRNLRLELELKSVYSQINPHFIFNTLTSIMYFIKKKELNEAYEHVSKFSRLLRAYIKSSRNRIIILAAEIENLNNYIQLQQARFENQFDYEIIVDSAIDAANISVPALLLQPVVENAIDHGLFHKETKGNLKIEFRKTALMNEICCIIDDDGVGRKKSKELSQHSLVKTESYGEQLITDLISVFNKYEKMNISIRYIDKPEPDTGTTVIINIKYLHDAK